jgi:hypothetical protein
MPTTWAYSSTIPENILLFVYGFLFHKGSISGQGVQTFSGFLRILSKKVGK